MSHFSTILLTLITSVLGAVFSNAGASALNDREEISSLMEKRDFPFQTITTAFQTSITEQQDGIWQLIDADGDGFPDLCLIKTSDTISGTVEIYILSAASNFQDQIWASGSAYSEETDGTWLLVPSTDSVLPDLVFIKTSNTGAGTTELHFGTGDSGYQDRGLEIGSVLPEELDGTWSIFDFDGDGIQDLVFLQTTNTADGTVNVIVASGASVYQDIIYDSGHTGFGEQTDGFWALVGVSEFSGNGDLSFIRTSGSGSGTVEVYIATKDSNYIVIPVAATSAFLEESDGVWSLVDINDDGFLDLVFVKTQNTGTGFVEINAASGSD